MEYLPSISALITIVLFNPPPRYITGAKDARVVNSPRRSRLNELYECVCFLVTSTSRLRRPHDRNSTITTRDTRPTCRLSRTALHLGLGAVASTVVVPSTAKHVCPSKNSVRNTVAIRDLLFFTIGNGGGGLLFYLFFFFYLNDFG